MSRFQFHFHPKCLSLRFLGIEATESSVLLRNNTEIGRGLGDFRVNRFGSSRFDDNTDITERGSSPAA
ncbi:hypothetical protein AAC387_Pa10g2182 [Persea americana]